MVGRKLKVQMVWVDFKLLLSMIVCIKCLHFVHVTMDHVFNGKWGSHFWSYFPVIRSPNYTQINLFLDLNIIFFILSIKSWPRPLDEEWGASFFGTIYKLLSLFLTKEPTPD